MIHIQAKYVYATDRNMIVKKNLFSENSNRDDEEEKQKKMNK